MTQLDEVERQRLAEEVSRIEIFVHRNTAILDAGVLRMLNHFIDNARQRITALDEEIIVESRHRKETEQQKLAALHRLAERELALTREERETYSRFLEKEAFTKSDFNALSKFYSGAWDRLSEGGKAEMSHRIWEGVRREEYHFSELPDSVKEKEAERLHQLLLKGPDITTDLEKIPQIDREDFQSAWKAGKRKEACEILDRPSFAENVALSSRKVIPKTGPEQEGDKRAAIAEAVAATEKPQNFPAAAATNETKPVSDADLSAVSLDKLQLGTSASKPTELPVNNQPQPSVPLKR